MLYEKTYNPTHSVTVKGLSNDLIDTIILTYVQHDERVIEKQTADFEVINNSDGSFKLVTKLTQDDTKKLQEGAIKVQMRIITTEGNSFVSSIWQANVKPVLNDDIIPVSESHEDSND